MNKIITVEFLLLLTFEKGLRRYVMPSSYLDSLVKKGYLRHVHDTPKDVFEITPEGIRMREMWRSFIQL